MKELFLGCASSVRRIFSVFLRAAYIVLTFVDASLTQKCLEHASFRRPTKYSSWGEKVRHIKIVPLAGGPVNCIYLGKSYAENTDQWGFWKFVLVSIAFFVQIIHTHVYLRTGRCVYMGRL